MPPEPAPPEPIPPKLTLADLLPWQAPPTLPPGTTPAQAQAALKEWHVYALAQQNSDGTLTVWILTPQGPQRHTCSPKSLAWATAQPLNVPVLLPLPPCGGGPRASEGRGESRLSLHLMLDAPLAIIEPADTGVGAGNLLGLLTHHDLLTADTQRGAALWHKLAPEQRQVLTTLLDVQRGLGRGSVALVGGAVRDLLLGQAAQDLDCVVVGQDAQKIAKALHQRCGGTLSLHPQYGNAALSLPDGAALDLIAARMERYPQPGQAPQVHSGTLAQDLARRDFGLNALALRLNDLALCAPPHVLDELAARTLRPLHPRSLHEDPSRLVRAARLAARLNLSAHPDLLAQVPDALALSHQTPRLWAELRLLLHEARPAAALGCLRAWGAELLPNATQGEALQAIWERLEAQLKQSRETFSPALTADLYAAALLSLCTPPQQHGLSECLGLGKRPLKLLERANKLPAIHKLTAAESALQEALSPANAHTVQPSYTPLSACDLLSLGYSTGPRLGQALAELQKGRALGRWQTREAERQAAQEYLHRQRS